MSTCTEPRLVSAGELPLGSGSVPPTVASWCPVSNLLAVALAPAADSAVIRVLLVEPSCPEDAITLELPRRGAPRCGDGGEKGAGTGGREGGRKMATAMAAACAPPVVALLGAQRCVHDGRRRAPGLDFYMHVHEQDWGGGRGRRRLRTSKNTRCHPAGSSYECLSPPCTINSS